MKYTWDLTRLFKNEEEFNQSISEIEVLLDEINTYKGNLLSSDEVLLSYLKLRFKANLLFDKVSFYASLGCQLDMQNTKFLEYYEKVEALSVKLSSVFSFYAPEMLASDYNVVDSYIKKNKELEKYTKFLKDTYRYKKYTLSDKEEKLLNDMLIVTGGVGSAYDTLSNIDAHHGEVMDDDGNNVELTSSNYGKFLSSRNENVRKLAFEKMFTYYKNHISTFSNLYVGQIKTSAFYSKVFNFNSKREATLFSDNIDIDLYDKLISVTRNAIKYLDNYLEYKSQVLGKKLHMYDLYVNTSDAPEIKISYDDGVKIINEALKPMGKEYLKDVNYLIDNDTIDVYPSKNKISGAFSASIHGELPYILLNYLDNIDSVSTLAHELGHSMHSYYSSKKQDYIYSEYSLFVAEIASTVNEILLSNYLISNANSKEELKYYLLEFLEHFRNTVYRQVLFAEFEDTIFKKYESGGFITKDLLCTTYYNLVKEYYGNIVECDELITYEWARISHFFRPYYVYQYATGFISALVIADRIQKDDAFKDKYIEFLSAGGSKFPLEILKDLDIDITDEKVLSHAFELFNEKVEMLKRLEKGE